MTARSHGLVLGKFMPPHVGHLHLIEVARRCADDLTVVVGTLEREPIPGALRHRWMTELCPFAHVVHLTDENPQEPVDQPDFWDIWRRSLARAVPRTVDYVFASESYGRKLAEILGARFIPVDPAREAVPVTATSIRADPFAHHRFLPPLVRAHYVQRVRVLGAESTGKSTLARALAAQLHTVHVPEHARMLLQAQGGRIAFEDMSLIARGQMASEDSLAMLAERYLICDTDVLTTMLWSEALFGTCPAWIRQEAHRRRYHLTLVTGVELPFEPDVVRYRPREREAFHARCLATLDARGERYTVLTGSQEARLAQARVAIDARC